MSTTTYNLGQFAHVAGVDVQALDHNETRVHQLVATFGVLGALLGQLLLQVGHVVVLEEANLRSRRHQALLDGVVAVLVAADVKH